MKFTSVSLKQNYSQLLPFTALRPLPCLLNMQHALHILSPQFQGEYASKNLNA